MSSTASGEVSGRVAPGLEEVTREFERNFAVRGESGAAFAVVHDGELVVDLWAGIADRATQRPWRSDTLAGIFSGTKGLVAICVLMLLERGELELDASVSAYWPEFGKEVIRVRDVVAHTAQLPGIDTPVTFEQFTDDRYMASLLATQKMSKDPRAAFTYHGLTYGWMCGELVRRVDGRSIGQFFQEEVAEPLDLELWIGLPEAHEPRVATLELEETWPASPLFNPARMEGDSLVRSIYGNPPIASRAGFPWNRRDYHAAEIPAAGAVGTARSIASLYGNLERVLRPATIELGRTTLSERWDPLLEGPGRFGVGFQLATSLGELGPVPEAFGHGGLGGSTHGCWPVQRIGFSYAMNRMKDDEDSDPRGPALLGALYRALS